MYLPSTTSSSSTIHSESGTSVRPSRNSPIGSIRSLTNQKSFRFFLLNGRPPQLRPSSCCCALRKASYTILTDIHGEEASVLSRYSHGCFYEKAHFVKGQRGGLSEATRDQPKPLRAALRAALLFALRLSQSKRRLGARWDPSGAKALPFEPRPPMESGGHTPNIRSRLGTERRTLGLSIGRLSRLTYWSYRYSWRRSPSGSLALTGARIVERIVDLRRNP